MLGTEGAEAAKPKLEGALLLFKHEGHKGALLGARCFLFKRGGREGALLGTEDAEAAKPI